MKFNNISNMLLIAMLMALSTGCKTNQKMSYKYNYETVENDPLGTKIYTLKNGLFSR